ncbi:hypothetical protein PV735_30120 [Streptomyces turgidiscabies]|uniref:Uncharacterized protein n=1 Tax=Streptomyces turgidiscabies (strain Car8) TaxID=698760 RepID=L7FJN9_STRT8|nr:MULTISPECIES: hypothetical protein [Streptomyces]ELP70925.1 hypothetical protein STRTUCAR8_07876 [Streptomyces turgidiscabies Car8]MDX3496910.1 hypothetical protein [Streptomyces turgidiscabies]
MTTPATTPAAVWDDNDPLMEALALAIWEQCDRQDYRTTNDDPRNIAAVAATVARSFLLPDTTPDNDDHPTPELWPTPADAYGDAPSINSEIGWTARTLAGRKLYTDLDRDFYLRKAALLDRIALLDEPDDPHGGATETAVAAAVYLIDTDRADVNDDPRGYVRRHYALWAKNQ